MTRLEETVRNFSEKCTSGTQSDILINLLAAAVVAAISILGAHSALASNPNDQFCSDRPWQCAPEAHAIVTAIHHSVAKTHSVAYSTLTVTKRDAIRYKKSSATLKDLVPQLAAKVSEIISTCGSKLISGYRPHAVVAGTHRASLHSIYPSPAADVAGHPDCIYALLHGWRGGYSVDYARVRHVHISLDLVGHREIGSRFVHGGGRRYARHHHRNNAG